MIRQPAPRCRTLRDAWRTRRSLRPLPAGWHGANILAGSTRPRQPCGEARDDGSRRLARRGAIRPETPAAPGAALRRAEARLAAGEARLRKPVNFRAVCLTSVTTDCDPQARMRPGSCRAEARAPALRARIAARLRTTADAGHGGKTAQMQHSRPHARAARPQRTGPAARRGADPHLPGDAAQRRGTDHRYCPRPVTRQKLSCKHQHSMFCFDQRT